MRKWILIGAAVLVFFLALIFCTTNVPTGHVGIITSFGRVEETATLDAGFHFKGPTQRIIPMDLRQRKWTYTLSAFSSDIQQVDIICAVTFNINKDSAIDLYKDVGTSYSEILVHPRVSERTKSTFSKYSAENLVSERDALSTKICENLRAEMLVYGINIISVSIEDIDFTDAFTDAVEAKQVAEQTMLRVQTEQTQQINVERAEAERRIIAAQANAEVAQTNADAAAYTIRVQAEAQAEANQVIAASLTNELINYQKINKWNGTVPTIQGIETIYPIVDLPE